MSGSYTHKKLTEVTDSAPRFGYSETQEARFASKDLELEATGISHHRVKPGRRQAFGHRHDEAEEVYVILAGSGRLKIDDAIIDVEERDAVRVAAGAIRQFEAGPDGLEVVAVGARHEGDGEIIMGWWSD